MTKNNITFNEFKDRYNAVRFGDFSYEGLITIYKHLQNCADWYREHLQLDMKSLYCEFSELEPSKHYANYLLKTQADSLIVGSFTCNGVEKLIVLQ